MLAKLKRIQTTYITVRDYLDGLLWFTFVVAFPWLLIGIFLIALKAGYVI